jgi:diacylglycerol kinase (ATP)
VNRLYHIISEGRKPQIMHRSWLAKFRDAFRGLALAAGSERSFAVHLPMAAAVLATGVLLRVSLVEACLLALCVTSVLAAELFNTAVERLAKGTGRQPSADIAAALQIASGAVLVAALGAAVAGGTIFLYRLGVAGHWWN